MTIAKPLSLEIAILLYGIFLQTRLGILPLDGWSYKTTHGQKTQLLVELTDPTFGEPRQDQHSFARPKTREIC
jgi:hypothetical protein